MEEVSCRLVIETDTSSVRSKILVEIAQENFTSSVGATYFFFE